MSTFSKAPSECLRAFGHVPDAEAEIGHARAADFSQPRERGAVGRDPERDVYPVASLLQVCAMVRRPEEDHLA